MKAEIETKDPSHALVIEGGAMRGIFAAGALDAFLDAAFNPFGSVYGVSAGATNGAAYLAGMMGRNYRVYTDYSRRPDFINLWKYVRGGHMLDIDWLWDITIREIRLDLEAIAASGSRFTVALTDTATGCAAYFEPAPVDLEQCIKASSAVPVMVRGFIPYAGGWYTDGGLSDPIPVIEAYNRGARRIIVLRSRPAGYVMKSKKPGVLTRALVGNPAVVKAMAARPMRYARALEFIRNPPQDLRVLEVCPPADFPVSRLTKDLRRLDAGYNMGLTAGRAAMDWWNKGL